MKIKTKQAGKDLFVVAPGVWGMKDVFVNIYVINNPAENNWWLVDTGTRWSGAKIKGMAELLFGVGSRPAAIILTHGHFDHAGSVKSLSEEWDVPVYAHHLEIPYLTGISSYPPADPAAGGGLLSDLSFLYPKGPVNIEGRVVALASGGTIPGLAGWEYIHTPGHSAGHISLFRESDKVLIAGDAIVTTKPESLIATVLQLEKISGPPKYLTSDWLSAASSVERLANLEPEVIASGHGHPLRGAGMRKSLHNLVRDFKTASVPALGRYSRQPALMDDSGVVHIPPKNINASTAPTLKILGITAAFLITVMLFQKSGKKRKKKRDQISGAKIHNNGSKHVAKPASAKIQQFLTNEVDKFVHSTKATSRDVKKKFTEEADKVKDAIPTKKDISKLKDDVKEKSSDVGKFIKEEANKIKKPALQLFDDLKFNIKKRISH